MDAPTTLARRRRAKPKNKRGQVLGDKGDRSRQRLMDAAFQILRRKSIWQISVSDICAHCDIAPSNLYTYFGGVEEVVLALAQRTALNQPDLGELLRGSWEGRAGLTAARQIIHVQFGYWSEYRPVLRVVELMADEGNRAFNEVRKSRLMPIYDYMRPLILRAQREGRIHSRIDPELAAISAMALVESAAMHVPLMVDMRYEHGEIIETQARLLLQHLTGETR